MTVRTDDRDENRSRAGDRTNDQVDVAPGVPMDRVRWGPILAGTFAALTMFALLTTLGTAIGLSAHDQGDDARRFAVGAGIWGVISMLVAFGFGGWLAARASAVRGRDIALLNGFMVAGVGIPALFLALGSASVLMSHAAITHDRVNDRDDGAQQASAIMSDTANGNANAPANTSGRNEETRETAGGAAWSTLIALVLAIGAASMAGLVGARDDREHWDRTEHGRGRRGDSTAAVA